MLKTIAAIVAAAVIAAIITVISAPIGDVVASPLPKPAADAIAACKQNPWPYVNCVGTEIWQSKDPPDQHRSPIPLAPTLVPTSALGSPQDRQS